MVEYLAIPAWDTPALSLDAWVECLTEAGSGPVSIRRESGTACWLLTPALETEGYVELEGGQPVAINFEVKAPDPSHPLAILTAAAHSVGWEIHDDADDDDRDDEVDISTPERIG